MGRDKAVLPFEGTTLVERSAATLASIAGETLLACGSAERYGDLGLTLVLDSTPDGGPLAGLEAGLARARTEWVAALAVDMPRADARVLALLHDRARERGLDACLLASEQGLEPLCAVYRRSCLEPVRAALAAGERRMTAFHAHIRVETLAPDEMPEALRRLGVEKNLNTPEDLAVEIEARRAR